MRVIGVLSAVALIAFSVPAFAQINSAQPFAPPSCAGYRSAGQTSHEIAMQADCRATQFITQANRMTAAVDNGAVFYCAFQLIRDAALPPLTALDYCRKSVREFVQSESR